MTKYLFILIFLFLNIYVPEAFSGSEKISVSFYESGLKKQKSGEMKSAVNDLGKALILDHRNQSAVNSLTKIANENKELPLEYKINILRLLGLVKELNKLENNIFYFESKLKSLEECLISKGFKKHFIEEELNKVSSLPQFSKVIDQNDFKISKNQESILIANLSLSPKIDFSYKKLLMLQTQCKNLIKINNQSNNSAMTALAFKMFNNGDVNNLDEQHSVKKQIVKTNTAAMKMFEYEIENVKGQIDELKYLIQEKDGKIVSLTKQIVDFSLQLTDKENTIKKNSENLEYMKKDFSELNSRFELGEKIINEKNQYIQELHNELKLSLDNLKNKNLETEKMLLSKEEMIKELTGIIGIYKLKLFDANKKAKEDFAKIITLEEQINSVQKALFEKEKSLDKAMEDLNTLELKLTNAEDKLFDLKLKSEKNQPASSESEKYKPFIFTHIIENKN